MATEMIGLRTAIGLSVAACVLAGCMGSQKGNGFNSFDYKYKDSIWNSDYSAPYKSHSFWYSGYSDDDIENAGSSGGAWGGGVGPSDGATSHGDSGSSSGSGSDSGGSQ
ncbi:MAG: hypothetical protein B7X02_01825 [Rhodospirillales bacterium 12-54-5]|nr:MAG: hypothetical protein B7X02_01825 [Rhodospirillales bacterium 12-54-5]